MNRIIFSLKLIFLVLVIFLTFSNNVFSQDAVKVDPEHYKIEFENEYVRVLRISYGPGEKSVMHEHPDAVAINLTDGKVLFHHPDGESVEINSKENSAGWTKATKHLPENIGDKNMEVILVELKHKN